MNTSLVAIAPHLWAVAGEVNLPAGARLPLRMTVLGLPDGQLALHSPVAIDDDVARHLARLGGVAHIIAPSAMHHLHVAACQERFPDARLHAPLALQKKRPDLRIDETLSRAGVWRDGVEVVPLRGAPSLDECVFFHRASGTLLVSDLLFNILRPEGLMTKIVLSCTGTRGRLAQSRLWNSFAKDKAAFAESVRQMLSWPFDRLVPCHGEVLETGARDAVTQALRWR